MNKTKILKKGGLIALGLASITTKKADEMIKGLIRKGSLNRKQGEALAKKAIAETMKEHGKVKCEVTKSVKRVMSVVQQEAKRIGKLKVTKPKKKAKKKKRR